ncbi:MAG: hypothetical protein Q8S84_01915 [bacterium]|nr:hypothetical protein [bacterium]MDP3380312.1 hypothetical protein [bacterium]
MIIGTSIFLFNFEAIVIQSIFGNIKSSKIKSYFFNNALSIHSSQSDAISTINHSNSKYSFILSLISLLSSISNIFMFISL